MAAARWTGKVREVVPAFAAEDDRTRASTLPNAVAANFISCPQASLTALPWPEWAGGRDEAGTREASGCSGIATAGQLALVAFRAVPMGRCFADEPDGHRPRCHPRGPSTGHAMAVGSLRAMPASLAGGPCAAHDSVGCWRFERCTAALRPLYTMRSQGRDYSNTGLGWTADADAGMATNIS